MSFLRTNSKITEIIKILNTRYTEHGNIIKMGNISLTNHSIQTARQLDEWSAGTASSIVAGLLHDYGHMINEHPCQINYHINNRHEILGARYLKHLGFPENILYPIRMHVQMKRYFKATQDDYKLHDVANKSLILQGGIMDDINEINKLKNNKYFDQTAILRISDDSAYKEDIDVISIIEFGDCIEEVLSKSLTLMH